MRIAPLGFRFSLTPEDLRSIREACEVAADFNGARLYEEFEAWEGFVDTDWSQWDSSEYDNDIACRFWIQLAIERSSPATRAVLEQQVEPLDERFRAVMKPARSRSGWDRLPLSGHPYFWETHTIHPDLGL